jgi:hypothetical protein
MNTGRCLANGAAPFLTGEDPMTDEPRNHRVTIHHTVGGDINKTLRVETFDMTATEWEAKMAKLEESMPRLIARGECRLNERGQCCGRKPIVYKRERHKFCTRCHSAFDIETGEQMPNWAWRAVEGGFVQRT